MRNSIWLFLLSLVIFSLGFADQYSQELKYPLREIPNVTVSISPLNPTTQDRITFTVTAYGNRGPSLDRIIIVVNNRKVKVCSMSPCIYRGGPYREGLLTYEITVLDKGVGLYSTREPWVSQRKVEVTKPIPSHKKEARFSGRSIHLIPLAEHNTTQWLNGTLALPFPGEDGDYSGFASYRYNSFLEDGRVYSKVLLTYPEWRPEYGMIAGKFKIDNIPENAIFKAEVGFLEEAIQTDGVAFRVFVNSDPYFYASKHCFHDGRLDELCLDLDKYAGQYVEVVLQVRVLGTSTQDWAVWVDPRVEW